MDWTYKNACNDNDELTFVSLAASTANVLRWLELTEEKQEERNRVAAVSEGRGRIIFISSAGGRLHFGAGFLRGSAPPSATSNRSADFITMLGKMTVAHSVLPKKSGR